MSRSKKQSRYNSESGVALLFGVITIAALVLMMFVVLQLTKARATAMRNLYLTIQTAQVAQHNIDYPQDALNLSMWPVLLEGYTGMDTPIYGEEAKTQSYDADGSGDKDGDIRIEYTDVADGQDYLTAYINRTEGLLAGAFGVLAGINTQAQMAATSSNSFISVHLDVTRRLIGTKQIFNLLNAFAISHDPISGQLTDIETDRKMLPYFDAGMMLYTDVDGDGSWEQNCAADFKDSAEVDNYYGRYVLELNTGLPGPDPLVGNGWCVNPWEVNDSSGDCCGTDTKACPSNMEDLPNGGCPSQWELLKANMSDNFISYKQAMEVMLQVLQNAEPSVRFSVFAAPSTGGNILEVQNSGAYVPGDIQLYDGSGNMYTNRINLNPLLRSRGPSAVGSCTAFNFPRNWNPHVGAVRKAEMWGRIDNRAGSGYPDLSTTNHQNSAQGFNYLRPLSNAFQPSYPWSTTISYEYRADDHAVWTGLLPLEPPGSAFGKLFPEEGPTKSHSDGRTASWPEYYDVDANGERTPVPPLDPTPFTNLVTNNYAPGAFKYVTPVQGGRDLRSVFENALAACNARKATDASAACTTIVVSAGIPELESGGDVPSCTTSSPIPYNTHITSIQNALSSYDALDNVYTILIYLDDNSDDGASENTFLSLFNNATHEKRFMLTVKKLPEATFRERLLKAVQNLTLLLREVAILQKSVV